MRCRASEIAPSAASKICGPSQWQRRRVAGVESSRPQLRWRPAHHCWGRRKRRPQPPYRNCPTQCGIKFAEISHSAPALAPLQNNDRCSRVTARREVDSPPLRAPARERTQRPGQHLPHPLAPLGSIFARLVDKLLDQPRKLVRITPARREVSVKLRPKTPPRVIRRQREPRQSRHHFAPRAPLIQTPKFQAAASARSPAHPPSTMLQTAPPAATPDRRQLLRQRRADENQHRPRRRFFECLEQRVCTLHPQQIRVINHRNPPRPHVRPQRQIVTEPQLPPLLRRPNEQLQRQRRFSCWTSHRNEVRMRPGPRKLAIVTHPARFELSVLTPRTQQSLPQCQRKRPLANPLGPHKQERTRQPPPRSSAESVRQWRRDRGDWRTFSNAKCGGRNAESL